MSKASRCTCWVGQVPTLPGTDEHRQEEMYTEPNCERKWVPPSPFRITDTNIHSVRAEGSFLFQITVTETSTCLEYKWSEIHSSFEEISGKSLECSLVHLVDGEEPARMLRREEEDSWAGLWLRPSCNLLCQT